MTSGDDDGDAAAGGRGAGDAAGGGGDGVAVAVLPCGDAAVLAEVADLDAARRLHAALDAGRLDGVGELVPAARTVLVRFDPRGTDAGAIGAWVTETAGRAGPLDAAADREPPLEVPVTYDGDDLEAVGEHTGLGADGVVDAHLATLWRVAFAGFAPGFGYLAAEDGPAADGRLAVPRRDESRTRVPVGAVGLAAELCGVYPRTSPGGWQLIGSTTLTPFDPDRDPPALMTPGRAVRFVRA